MSHISMNLLRNKILAKTLHILLIVFGVFAMLGTYYVVSLYNNLELRSQLLVYFVYLDIILVFIIFFIILRKVAQLWLKRHKRGSRLHLQTAFLFSIIAVIPSLFVFFFNYLFLNTGIELWFGAPVKSALYAADKVAESYIEENIQNIRLHALSIVTQLSPHMAQFQHNPQALSQFLNDETVKHNLSEALIFNADKEVLGRSYLTLALDFEKISFDNFERVMNNNEAVVLRQDDRLRVLVCLDPTSETYLFLGKILDAQVIQNIGRTKLALSNFKKLQIQKSDLRLKVTLILAIVSLLLVLSAIWFGLNFADRFMFPIANLITAAQRIREGDWSVRAQAGQTKNELDVLIRAFNMMLDQLYTQHQEIMHEKNMTETIIQSVSAGILGVNRSGMINLSNVKAEQFLDMPHERIVHKNLHHIFFELACVFQDFLKKRVDHLEDKVLVHTKDGVRTLQVHMGRQQDRQGQYIITFDDVTDLLIAQKKSSWADIAQRIAHEIKNPLTPILLSAERLKKRYQSSITEKPEIFNDCIDIIIRQVHNIFSLVKQFKSFAHSTSPEFAVINFSELGKKLITFFQESHSTIEFEYMQNKEDIAWYCDEKQVQQMLINLLNNAIDSIKETDKPRIRLSISDNQQITVCVEDNGVGFSEDIMDRLTEPYVTTKAEGTGLGLAIVSRIVQDHKGTLKFTRSPLGGAQIEIAFEVCHGKA